MSLRGFDWQYYLEKYPDLGKAGIDNKRKAMLHYQQYGEAENRFPNKNIEQCQKNLLKKKYYKLNKSNSSKEEIDLLSSQTNDYGPEIKINELNKNFKQLNKDIINIKKDIQKINSNFNNLFLNIKKLIQNNNISQTESKSSKISSENNNLSIKEDKSSKISTDNKNSKKTISRIESSEEYDLNNNISEHNFSEEEESDNENNNVIVKYSNSEENNLNEISLDNSINNLIQSSDSFSKNLSYEK
jgi:hypothetical protein